jgi:hypothetical protein
VRTATGITNPGNVWVKAVLPWEPNSGEPSALHFEDNSLDVMDRRHLNGVPTYWRNVPW